MTHFSLTDLSNRLARSWRLLFEGRSYDRLVSAADTRSVFHADDAPEEVAAKMLAALEAGDS